VFTDPLGPRWAFHISVELHQNVVLDRDPNILSIGATTWSSGEIGTLGKGAIRDLRDHVKDHIDKFINAYLAVNAK
jgi:hypothetical protein